MSENTLINSVLCYTSTARHSQSEQSIISACLSFFKNDEITEAKEILYNAVDEPMSKRKGENKARNDLSDVLALLTKCDSKDKELPKFLCDGYNKMPPASGFEVLASHMVCLIEEVANLKSEVSKLKTDKGSDQTAVIKEELRDIKLLLNRVKSTHDRQIFPNASDYGLNEVEDSLFSTKLKSNSVKSVLQNPAAAEFMSNISDSAATSSYTHSNSSSKSEVSSGNGTTAPIAVSSMHGSNNRNNSFRKPAVSLGNAANAAEDLTKATASTAGRKFQDSESRTAGARSLFDASGNRLKEDENEGWVQVRGHKRQKFITGAKSGTSSSFKGVQQTKDLFIGRCELSVSVEKIERYVFDEFGVNLFQCKCISHENAITRSFKITMLASETEQMLDSERWPENVQIRRFVHRNSHYGFRS